MMMRALVVMVILMGVAATGCGVSRCRVERVPVTFADGTSTEWAVTVCRRWF